jgi:four helix bundle protein
VKIEKFEDIKSWQKAKELVKLIYCVTKEGKFSKDFGLRDQIQRASVSIMSNIAEGFDSGTQKSFINFLNYSYRSTSEVQSLLYVANDINYISKEQFKDLYHRSREIKKLIGGFIQYLTITTN